jgi:hypothetical protein
MTSLENGKAQFKVALRKYLSRPCFYCGDEYVMFKDNQ